MSNIISVSLEKGGVGKTTTVLNIGAGLQQLGQNVLLVDLDQQSHLSRWLEFQPDGKPTISKLIYQEVSHIHSNDFADFIRRNEKGKLDFIPANKMLSGIYAILGADGESNTVLSRIFNSEFFQKYNYIIFDCPTAVDNLLVSNALQTSTKLLLPVQAELLAYESVPAMLQRYMAIKQISDIKPYIQGILVTMFNGRTNMSNEVFTALTDGLVNQNCALNITLPKVEKQEIQVLTHGQENCLIKESYFYRYGTFVRLTLCTGLRLEELLALKWEDVDFSRNELKVRRILHRCKNYDSSCKNSTSIYFDEPKTAKSKRTIPLPKNAIDDLKLWQEKQSEEIYNPDFIITDRNGKHLEHTTFKKYYNRFLDKCGISGITFHALRHTFATNALEKGMDKKVLSEILGHSSVAFTLDTYAHVLSSFKRENMDLMNDIYQKQVKAQNIVLSFKPFKKQYIVDLPPKVVQIES